MKNPFKKAQTPKHAPSQERKPSTPSAVQNLTDTDLERVQGGLTPISFPIVHDQSSPR